MELLTYTVPTVRFDFPDSQTAVSTATYTLNGGIPATLSPITSADTYATVKLPYQSADGKVQVTWSFAINGAQHTRTQYYDVVTPLLSPQQVREIIGQNNTDDEVYAAEAAARYIIQSYTGQTFGKYIGPLSITGGGEGSLRLPRRLLKLNSINSDITAASYVNVRGDGWFLVSLTIGAPSIRADWDGWHQIPNSGVITPPPRWTRSLLGFGRNLEFAIDGIWGWDYVPAQVVEAAKLLVNDYACADAIYRDRYITAVSGPDWQMEFNMGAYTSTGNVRADQLLAEFKLRRGWQVV